MCLQRAPQLDTVHAKLVTVRAITYERVADVSAQSAQRGARREARNPRL
jgi:hypothetical protein